MPSLDLFTYFQNDLVLQRSWFINGRHYSLTCEDWLKKQDERANRQRWLNGAGMLEGKDKGDKRGEETVMYYRWVFSVFLNFRKPPPFAFLFSFFSSFPIIDGD